MAQRRYVIVGAGLAGAKAAEAIRASGDDGSIVLLGEERHRPYERPELSKGFLKGKKAFDDLAVHDEGWYAEHDVDLRLGAAVRHVDLQERRVLLGDGTAEGYDALLIASGSAPRTLPVPGGELPGVHTLRTFDDAQTLRAVIEAGGPIVVVGGGWIGLEVAAVAREHGAQVTIVEPMSAPLMRALGEQVGEIFAQLHRSRGVDVRTGSGVNALRGTARVEGVELETGQVLEAAAVVVGIGIRPRTELAEAAGLTLDNGIAVDGRVRTSDPNVWAAGDVANAVNSWAGRRLRVEHWANAQDQGGFAGRSMAGDESEWAKPPYFYTDQYDAGMEYWGWADPTRAELVLRGRPADGEYLAFWLVAGEVAAGMHVNRWDDADAVKALVKARARLDPQVLANSDRELPAPA